jgi:hypothetical protein
MLMAKAKKAKATVVMPVPVKSESRICFGIVWFSTEADAETFAASVTARGVTYNGGFFHGMACGRDRTWDHEDPTLGKLFAVTN